MSYHHGNLRQDLLQRAAEVIAGEGIEKLSLRALARDLGVSHSAPARHFKDKAALLSALAEESYTRVVTELDTAMEAAGTDPMARYNAIGKALVAFALERPAYFRAMFHPEVRNRMNDNLEALHTSYMDRLLEAGRAAQAVGWLPGHDPEIAVLFSTAAAEGIARILTDTRDKRLLDGRDPAAIGQEVIDIVIAPHSSSAPQKGGAA